VWAETFLGFGDIWNQVGTFGGSPLFSSMKNNKGHGVTQDDGGQDQPKDKRTAQHAGLKKQQEAAKEQVESRGEPAGGE
jgi:hypothetical protein